MIWCKNGERYSQLSGTEIKNELPVGVYQLRYDQQHDLFYLVKMSGKFDFNYKIYGIEKDFIERVLKTYSYTVDNMGVLLYGIKGTGKTVTAKILANSLNNPCILVNEYHNGMNEFLSSIENDCTIFFDEFEKSFCKDDNEGIADLLSLMDGVYTNGGRKMYLLTCNTLNIEDSFLGRPSRIRYSKEFGNLKLEVVEEYLNDNLLNKELASDVIKQLNKLAIVTMDTIKCLVEEINIHEYVDGILDDFNAEKQKYHYKVEYSESRDALSLDEFRKILREANEHGTTERYNGDLRSKYLTLNKPVEELVLNDKISLYYMDLVVVKPITEDKILTCRSDDNEIIYLHVVNGGKFQSFFQNIY